MGREQTVNSRTPVYTPGLLVVFAFSCGIAADRFFNFHWCGYLVALVAAAVAAILLKNDTSPRHRFSNDRHIRLMVSVIMVGFVAVGALRHHVYWNWYPENEVGFRASSQPAPVAVKVTLINEPRQIAANPDGYGSSLVRCDEIRDGDRWVKTSGRVWLRMPVIQPSLSAGDQVKVFGTLVRIEGPSNPGQYDFSRHYRRQRILASLYCFNGRAITVLKSGGYRFISNLRTRLEFDVSDFAWQSRASRRWASR